MKPMPPEVKTNQQMMREYIQRERRVELFMRENVRGLAACIWSPPVRKNWQRKAFGNPAEAITQNVRKNTGLPITVHYPVASE